MASLVRAVVLLMLAAGTLATAAEPTSLTLAADGRPGATLLLAATPTRAAQLAACELQWHLSQITGAPFAIAHEGDSGAGLPILVGDSRPVRDLGINVQDLSRQEYIIRFVPPGSAGQPRGALVLAGRDKDDRGTVHYSQPPAPGDCATWPGIWDEQGTLYAVYDFLERCCNVRWFTPTELGTDIPRQTTLTVTGTDLRRAPFFGYRYAAYPAAEAYDQYTGLWPGGSEGFRKWEAAAHPELHKRYPGGDYNLAKRGWNQLFRLRHREGGEICLANHSLYGYYRRFWEAEQGNEAVFEGKHADWFARGYSGRPPQMCYTSRGLVEQVARDAREYFDTGKTHPGAVTGGDFFCVEPMDNAQFCKCQECSKWLTGQDADSPFFSSGRNSDYFFNFVNEVAREVRKTHPDRWIVALAYMSHAAHPQRVQLEPNVAIQYCFACNRLNFDRPSYEHEVAQLKEWRRLEPDRPLYLWLYYTFPVEVANNGHFHCFPGFFAHAVGEQFDLFRALKLRGMFHCGYGQEVEAYVTYQLMNDPSLKLDTLLDEFFTRQYGPAAAPMRRLYEAIERTYSDPASYPEPIASGKTEGHHHQVEEVAWGYLGNARRMGELGKLMGQAQAAAQTPEQKQRVALFGLGTWDYMTAGRELYTQHARARFGGQGAPLRVPFASRAGPDGDPARLQPAEALAMTGWRSAMAEPTRRKLLARALTDGKFLYLRLEEARPGPLRFADDIISAEYWEVLLAAQRGEAVHKLLLNGAGRMLLDGTPRSLPLANELGDTSWAATVAVPLTLLSSAASPGRVFVNLIRRSAVSEDQPMWSPSFGGLEDPTALRELILDGPATIPANVPTGAELAQRDAEGLVARWRLDEGGGATVRAASGDLAGSLVNGADWGVEGGHPAVQLEDRRQQCVDLGHSPRLNLTGALTLMAWLRYEPTDTWYPGLLGKGYEATGTYGLHLRPGNTVWFEVDAPDGTRFMYNPTDLVVPPGQWCHVAATYDGKLMRVYVNGREAGPGRAVATVIRANDEPLRFGWLGSYGYFNGAVRNLSLHARALTAAEVFGHYLAGR